MAKNTIKAGVLATAIAASPMAGAETVDTGNEKAQEVARVQAFTKSQVQRHLLICDGIDRQGVIHEEKKDGELKGYAEKKCVREAKIAELDADNAQLDADNAQLDADNARLKRENAKLQQISDILSKKK